MSEIELLVCAAVLAGLVLRRLRGTRRKPSHGLPHLERAMQGRANGEQLLELADALAKSVIQRAKSLKKTPLFITASGDVYDDFFPPREPHAGSTAEQYANSVLAECVARYREARNNRNMVDIADFPAYTLCAGAGLAVSAFRRLGASSQDMRDLAEFLAPAPEPEDWEKYREHYREAGLLLGLSRARLDAKLVKRREYFGEAAGDIPPVQ